MEPFLPIQVAKYTEKEFESCYQYYLDSKWLQHEKGEICARERRVRARCSAFSSHLHFCCKTDEPCTLRTIFTRLFKRKKNGFVFRNRKTPDKQPLELLSAGKAFFERWAVRRRCASQTQALSAQRCVWRRRSGCLSGLCLEWGGLYVGGSAEPHLVHLAAPFQRRGASRLLVPRRGRGRRGPGADADADAWLVSPQRGRRTGERSCCT